MSRYVSRITVALAFALVAALHSPAQAAPITGNSGPGGFQKTNVSSDLGLWLKADTFSLADNTPIPSWTDSSFFGLHATASASPDRRPRYRTGGPNTLPVMRFDGVDDYMTSPLNAVRGTFLVVTADRASGSSYALLDDENMAFLTGTAGLRPGIEFSQSNYSETHTVNAFRIMAGTTTGTAPFAFSRNGVVMTPAGSTSSASFATTSLNIGARVATNSLFLNGDIAEIVVFNRALVSSERIIAENHLSAKYNLALGANDKYLGDDNAKGDYDRDVFGIGRVGVGNEVTTAGAAGFGIEASGTMAADDYVLAGHKTVANGISTLNLTEPGKRWERSWYVDATGAVNATLTFNWTDTGLGAQFDPTFTSLMFRSLESGTFSALSPIGSYTGQQISFLVNGIQDGYYTLGMVTPAPIPEPASAALLGLGCLALTVVRRRRSTR